MNNEVIYAGKDLEAMSFAENYHRWILDIFEPYLGRRVVEVGAGRGAFSKLILERSIESLSVVEPSSNMFPILQSWVENFKTEKRIDTYNAIFANVAEEIARKQQPDSIIYVNVLEHIRDDLAELEHVHRTLVDGGCVLIFSPACQWLYGSFDKLVGHHRRYTRSQLADTAKQAGFRVLTSGYLDFPGMFPWWVKYKVVRSQKMEAWAVRFYDTYVIPVLRIAESVIRPPVGRNLFLVAEKI